MITLLHEVTHLLGFSSGMYDQFIDRNNGKRLEVSEVYYSSNEILYIKTPKVL